MRRTASIIFAAALAFGAVAADDGADDTEDLTSHPCYDAETEALSYTEEQVWFHEGDAKLANDAPAPWDTTAPDTSVQGGAGAGVVSPGTTNLAADTPADTYAVFAGTFTGCLDTMLFDVYSFDPTNRTGTSANGEPADHQFGLTITVNGEDIFSGGPLAANSTFANEGVGPNLNQFAVNLGDTMELYDSLGLLELDGEHQIEVRMNSWYVNTGHGAYVWDTTEVPSGITFNGVAGEDHAAVN